MNDECKSTRGEDFLTGPHVFSWLLTLFFVCIPVLSVMAQEDPQESKADRLQRALMQPGEPKAAETLIFPTATSLEAPSPLQNRQANNNQQWEHTRQVLRTTTLVGLWVTGGLGTVVALNRPTLLGEGRCQTGNPIFGDYGCGELSTVHGIAAVTSIVSYTASEVLELTIETEGRDSRTVTWIHRAGIAILPLVGIFSRYPEVIGITGPEAQEDFSRAMRSIHAGAGYATVVAYTIEF